jgi:anti-sigma factor RsiW
MDCKTVHDRLAAWLDGELAPADQRWLEQHLERCMGCSQQAADLAEQQEMLEQLPPPSLPRLHEASFWAPMQAKLAPALDELQRRPLPKPIKPSFWRRELAITPVAITIYGALMAALLLWSLRLNVQLDAADVQIQDLTQQVERSERLDAAPLPLPAEPEPAYANDSFRPVNYTPERGHF